MTHIEAMKQALTHEINLVLTDPDSKLSGGAQRALQYVHQQIQAIATEESSATQEPVAWNGKPLTWKLVPVVPTQAMLDEMNLTGREGYDEVMGDGFSASLYGAALIAAPAQPKAEQEHDEVTKLKGEIGVLVGLLGAAQQVIETIDAENAEESEALIHLHMKITYAIQGASSL